MSTRRQFLVTAALAGAAAVAGVVPAVAMKVAASKYPGVVYTAQDQGKWEGKGAIHAPLVIIEDGKLTIMTPHSMSQDHFIVRHTLVALDGTVLGAKTFAPTDKPLSEYDLPGKGRFIATSFCNLHDLWVTEFLA